MTSTSRCPTTPVSPASGSASARHLCLERENHARWRLLDRPRLDPERPQHRGYRRKTDLRVSAADPEAAPIQTGVEPTLGYRDRYVVDGGRARIILSAAVPPGDVMDQNAMPDLLHRVRFRLVGAPPAPVRSVHGRVTPDPRRCVRTAPFKQPIETFAIRAGGSRYTNVRAPAGTGGTGKRPRPHRLASDPGGPLVTDAVPRSLDHDVLLHDHAEAGGEVEEVLLVLEHGFRLRRARRAPHQLLALEPHLGEAVVG